VILVVGLGNPGAEYAQTRHNIGFMVADCLGERCRADWRDKFHGSFCLVELAGERACLLKPKTYMNESGRSVGAALGFYKLGPPQALVVHDDLDLPFGVLRLKEGGGDAGHRGLRSIAAHLGSSDFTRLRVGIGRPPADFRGDAAAFVLRGFSPAERADLDDVVQRAADAVTLVLARGLAAAMNATNQRTKN
jgi:peptidyl-tRNA hydrolase, PTH1 family